MVVEKCFGKDVIFDWWWWLFVYVGIYGFVVSVLMGIFLFGVVEMIVYGLIDYGKCCFGYKLIVD